MPWFLTSAGGGATALDDLTDVTITAAALYDRLHYDGTGWVNTDKIWRPLLDDDGAIVTDDDGAAVMGLSPP